MNEKPANKHKTRTTETRALLLRAAEEVFVRDGYERAELGEIAELAGRTKGAIYAHFESKENIFLALIADRRAKSREMARQFLNGSSTAEESRRALREFYLTLAENPVAPLLTMEFKLFALRHPESKKRLTEFDAESLAPKDEERIAKILGPSPSGALSRVDAIRTIHDVLSALSLQAKYDSRPNRSRINRKIIGQIFDALIGPSTKP